MAERSSLTMRRTAHKVKVGGKVERKGVVVEGEGEVFLVAREQRRASARRAGERLQRLQEQPSRLGMWECRQTILRMDHPMPSFCTDSPPYDTLRYMSLTNPFARPRGANSTCSSV